MLYFLGLCNYSYHSIDFFSNIIIIMTEQSAFSTKQVYDLVLTSLQNGATVTDIELDDNFFIKYFAQKIPLMVQCLRKSKDCFPHDVNKANLFEALNGGNKFKHVSYLEYNEPDFLGYEEDGKDVAEVVTNIKALTKDIIYLNVIAPCARLLNAIQSDKDLASLPKVFVMYSGEYNLKFSGILRTLLQDPKNRIVDFSRMVFFGGPAKEPPQVKNLSALLGGADSEDWKLIQKSNPQLFKTFQTFQLAFNKKLINPTDLLDKEMIRTLCEVDQTSFKEYVSELHVLYEKDIEAYRAQVVKLFPVDHKWYKCVRAKKWSILKNVEVDSPIADMIIPLFIIFYEKKVPMECVQGDWSVNNIWSQIVPSKDGTGNGFYIQLKEPESVIPLVREFVLSMFGLW